MLVHIKNKKQYLIKKDNRARIEKEIKGLDKLPKGIYAKFKNNEHGFYIKIIVDKNYIAIDKTDKIYSTLPDVINFLIILDYSFPEEPPKILCQTNVSLIKIIIIYTKFFINSFVFQI